MNDSVRKVFATNIIAQCFLVKPETSHAETDILDWRTCGVANFDYVDSRIHH